jgi:L-iditol 2-dehydrogenase
LAFVQGHGWTGEVVAVGPGVDGLKLGDRVAGETTKGCLTCDFCRHGRYNLCLNFGKRDKGYILYGHDTYGAFCEYVARPPVTLHELPDSVSDEEAVMLSQVIIALPTVERPGVRPTDVTLTSGRAPSGSSTSRSLGRSAAPGPWSWVGGIGSSGPSASARTRSSISRRAIR